MITVSGAMEKALLQHFICRKLEISYAIQKPFPFFEGLRDKSFITEKMYRESLEACTNLVPVSRVVYNTLTQLEKTFNLSLLLTLFSQINLREYPNLMEIFGSFRSVGASYGERSRTTALPLKAPAERYTLLPLIPPHPPSLSHLSCAPRVSEPRAALQQIHVTLDELPSTSDPATPPPDLIQEGRSTPAASDNLTPEITEEEDSQEMPSTPPGAGQVVTENSPESNDPEEPHEATITPPKKKGRKIRRNIWSTPKRRRQKKSCPREAASPGHRNEEKLPKQDQETPRKDHSTCSSRVVTRAQKARITHAWASRQDQKPKDDLMDFLSPELPVTCGTAKGILYKEKMKRGSSEKCIQNEEGAWFTPQEFAIKGKGRNAKNWKWSVRCQGKTLSQLLEVLQ
ncbi:sp110 nuclear body protein isoform X1 [Marmota marmota marmota]|uniref:sp110 nuclear body protein isoform X1 n=1 Tax=Marmota marmota marmota TaxID=9994 RepID=UPI000762903C|nr:sp110 nuclear body protein isoform X1 [Marmota marmota marmota]XP_015336991.1 sp110 nuclear body protein isoform X1 [Marmota marmota marmota]XP_048664658.1 sp110 nuclear body protein isoform X1 [Marmota marmota marmota]